MTSTTMTIDEAAAFLKMHPETIRQRITDQENPLPGAKPGKCWVFIKEDLVIWLQSFYPQTR
mgnify:CR=1 FL=1